MAYLRELDDPVELDRGRPRAGQWESGLTLQLRPVWAKVINTDGQVWRVSSRARKKERRQQRRRSLGTADAPSARRDGDVDVLEFVDHEVYLIICDCGPDGKGLEQLLVKGEIEPRVLELNDAAAPPER
jgi:hypothetical protein